MSGLLNLYQILELPVTASEKEIKAAFRKLAFRSHPDRNANRPESAARFRIIHNAYAILIDSELRRNYDRYLKTSAVFGDAASSRRNANDPANRVLIQGTTDTRTAVLNHLNFILWEIEDLIRARPDWNRSVGEAPLRVYVLQMLAFIDRWILEPSGFPDYFFQARGIKQAKEAQAVTGHRPYVGIDDYFYNIRVRTDRLISHSRLLDLLSEVPGTEVRIVDCIVEAHNLCVHYLAYIKDGAGAHSIPPFRYTNRCFADTVPEQNSMKGDF